MRLFYLLPTTLFVVGMGTITHFTLAQSFNQLPMNNTSAQERSSKSVGGLYVQSEDGEKQIFPLKHTDVKAKIAGNVSRVEVTQTFENPFKEPLEAVYVFPLPD